MAGWVGGQTRIDLRTQGKNVDYSTAASTRPSKTGTLAPATCAIGETFLKTDAPAGKNSYVCTAQNVWTVQGVEVPDVAGKVDQLLSNDGAALGWRALGGDIGGQPNAVTVNGLRGRNLGSMTPLDGQFLKWNGVTAQYVVEHSLQLGGGTAERVGSLGHELTHVSSGETFENTPLFLLFDPASSAEEIVAMAAARNMRCMTVRVP